MTLALPLLVSGLVIWMLACAVAGYRFRFLRFCVLLLTGLAINLTWMVFGLQARLTEPSVVIALGAATLYAASAFALGIVAGRFMRLWRASAVDSTGVRQ